MTTGPAPIGARRALVTGATGFVGSRLAARLVGEGWSTHALVRPGRAASLPIGVAGHDIPNDAGALAALVDDIDPSMCYHLATYFRAHHDGTDIEPMIDANVTFGTRLLEAVSALPACPFVNTASAWQHFEGAVYAPVSLYAATKQAFEDMLRYYVDGFALAAATLVLYDTYGAGDTRSKLVPALLDAAREGRVLELSSGTQLIDLLHVDDAVEALLATGAALATPHTEDVPARRFAASSGRTMTVRELVTQFRRAADGRPEVVWDARPDRPREMRTPWTVAPPPPDWAPRIDLTDGVRNLVATDLSGEPAPH